MAAIMSSLVYCLILISCLISPSMSGKLRSKINFKDIGNDVDTVAARLETRAWKWSDLAMRKKNKDSHDDSDSGGNEAALRLGMKLCHPYLSVVKVEEPGDRDQFYWPSFVELHRCAGGCFVSPEAQHCKVTQQESVALLVKDVRLNIVNEKIVVMSNHTSCSCACVEKVCNERQKFNKALCRCECIVENVDCENQVNKTWNEQSCQCECKFAGELCSKGEKWSEDSCNCEPNESVSV